MGADTTDASATTDQAATTPAAEGAANAPQPETSRPPLRTADRDSLTPDVDNAPADDARPGPFEKLRPEEQEVLIDTLVDDSNPRAPLERRNAAMALHHGPPGTTIRVAGRLAAGPDVTFVDGDDNVVLAREIKAMVGDSPRAFRSRIKAAARQMAGKGEVWIQLPRDNVPPNTAATLVRSFQDDDTFDLGRYSEMTAVILDRDGLLGRYALGELLPEPDDEEPPGSGGKA